MRCKIFIAMSQFSDAEEKEQADESSKINKDGFAENIEHSQQYLRSVEERRESRCWVLSSVAMIIILLLQICIYAEIKRPTKENTTTNATQQTKQKVEPAVKVPSLTPVQQPSIKYASPRPLIYKPAPKWKPTSKGNHNNETVSLWDMTREDKIAIFKKGKEFAKSKSPKDKFMDINYDKDEETAAFFKKYEADSHEFNWANLTLSVAQMREISTKYQLFIKDRRRQVRKWIERYAQKYANKKGHLDIQRGIYYSEFVEALSFMALTGQDIAASPALSALHAREKKHYEKRYNISAYKTEIPLCIITPTYNNVEKRHYVWNTEAILQQEYSNFKWIIVDDASTDGTLSKIAAYLKWRNAPKDKVTLVASQKHRTALENIYYAAHKYCDYGQIMFIIDGDDEIIGTQVFKLYNAIYQKQKPYILYSNFFNFKENEEKDPLWIGISRDYPLMIKQHNNYRRFYHSYSQLRTSLTDIFFMLKLDSLKDAKGQIYWTLYDNAIYFPSMELSCAKVKYLPELLYWYYTNSGTNDSQTSRREEYNIIFRHIAQTQKPYTCIDDKIAQIRKKLIEKNKIISASNKKP